MDGILIKKIKSGKKVNLGFEYSSDLNSNWMTVNQIKNWIKKNFDN